MATGRSMQLTKQIGEYLVSAELCRRGLIATTFTGNVPGFDVLVTDEYFKTLPIQVKTIRGGSWQFDAKKFMEISMFGDKQEIKGKTKLLDPNLIYVFVRLRGKKRNEDEFYICREKDVQDIAFREYTEWLATYHGVRPNKPESTHCSVKSEYLKNYRDKWETITKSKGFSG